jgi:hypothetical protein
MARGSELEYHWHGVCSSFRRYALSIREVSVRFPLAVLVGCLLAGPLVGGGLAAQERARPEARRVERRQEPRRVEPRQEPRRVEPRQEPRRVEPRNEPRRVEPKKTPPKTETPRSRPELRRRKP